jgi:hypothetical protein
MLLGERLVRSRIVTVDHVQQALELQAVHGGRLGTNLLLKSFIDIDTLSNALSRHVGAPAAKQKHFERVDEQTLQLIPAHLAVKHRAVPLALVARSGRELLVALRDPHDVKAIDEIALAAGARVRPFIAPELCILRFIERYYGPLPAPSLGVVGWANEAGRAWDEPDMPEQTSPPAPSSVLLPQMIEDLVEHPNDARPFRKAPFARSRPALAVDAAVARLEETDDREAIGTIIVDFLRSTYRFGLLFIVKKAIAHGWTGFGPGIAPASIEALSVPLDPSSILGTAFANGALFKGPPCTAGSRFESLLYDMPWERPQEAIAAPILVKGRVVNLIYAHASDREALPEFAAHELTKICETASESLVRVIQAQKKNFLLQT